ncbi:MAG: hypothetical protein D3M94_09680 [Rhodocyclales bacterium GT-UBC]|nr:MAG: hypothetical protein D3M94_09680 [Rhodocyclales bacterium GT-UBC]
MLAWAAAVVICQYLDYPGLVLMVVVAQLSAPQMWRVWFNYLRRARWLFLTLWLILAYNTPGESLLDSTWAPTYEGMAEASVQAARLAGMLALLAWLFARQGRDGLVAGLWWLMLPLTKLGVNVERGVVRLSLVLDNLQREHEKGAWKKMLAGDVRYIGGPDALHLVLPPWRVADTLFVMALIAALCGVMVQ